MEFNIERVKHIFKMSKIYANIDYDRDKSTLFVDPDKELYSIINNHKGKKIILWTLVKKVIGKRKILDINCTNVVFSNELKDIIKKFVDNVKKITFIYKVTILTFDDLLTTAEMISYHLKKMGLSPTISNVMNEENVLYIGLNNLFIKKNKCLPYIFYQIEQSSNKCFEKKEYLEDMESSLQIWECFESVKLKYSKHVTKPIRILPLPFAPLHRFNSIKKEYDLIFFGTINRRRRKLLNLLSRNFNLKILEGVYGYKRDVEIQKSKFIINLHYYDNPELEIDRINIGILNGVITLSENVGNDIEMYKKFVKFFDAVDDIKYSNNMISFIKQELKNYKSDKNINRSINELYKKCYCDFKDIFLCLDY